MDRRSYLVTLGLAKPGRGKFSREAQEALTKARQDGMTFDDEAVQPVKVKEPSERATKASNKIDDLRAEAPRRFRQDEFNGTDTNGKRIIRTFKDVCNVCRVSMGWCSCPSGPQVYGIDTETLIAVG